MHSSFVQPTTENGTSPLWISLNNGFGPPGEMVVVGKSCDLKLLEQVFSLIDHSEVKRALAGASLADVCFRRTQGVVCNLGSFLSLDALFTCVR